MNKKKGFTIIELLAVIVILGIVSTIVTVSINQYLNRSKNDYNKSLEGQLLIAGKSYYAENSSKRPIGKKYKTYITLGELEARNLISRDFVDSNKGLCDSDKSFVSIERDPNQNSFKYNTCLVCENYKTKDGKACKKINENDNEAPTCEVEKTNQDDESELGLEYSVKFSDEHSIASVWKTTEYDGQSNKRENLEVNNATNEYTLEDLVSIDERAAGQQIKITYYAMDEGGNYNGEGCSVTYTIPEPEPVPDPVPDPKPEPDKPVELTGKCSVKETSTKIDESIRNKKNGWYNDNLKEVTITATCTGTNCPSQNIKKQTYKTQGTYNFSHSFDGNNGNKITCTGKTIKIDRAKPTCTVSGMPSNKWSNVPPTATAKCRDTGGSDCLSETKTYEFTSTTNGIKTHKFTVTDNAGNKGGCSAEYGYDKTPPTCTVSGVSSSWVNESYQTATAKCTDTGGSKCTTATTTQTHKFTDEGSKSKTFTVKDLAGNSGTCKATSKIDRTPPTCNGYEQIENSSTGNIQFKYTFKDELSGVTGEKHGHCYRSDSWVNKEETCAYKSITSRLSDAGYTTFSAATTKTKKYNYRYNPGKVYILFKLKDAAGNAGICELHKPTSVAGVTKYSYTHAW